MSGLEEEKNISNLLVSIRYHFISAPKELDITHMDDMNAVMSQNRTFRKLLLPIAQAILNH